MTTETATAITPVVVTNDDDIVAIVWADGTFTTGGPMMNYMSTFAGGRSEAKAALRKATG